jgi:hypothetical protein
MSEYFRQIDFSLLNKKELKVSSLQAHTLIQIYTNTDYCLPTFYTWIPTTIIYPLDPNYKAPFRPSMLEHRKNVAKKEAQKLGVERYTGDNTPFISW